jgi:hypothetical protein
VTSRRWAAPLLVLALAACQATPSPSGSHEPGQSAPASGGPGDSIGPEASTEVVVGAGDFFLPDPTVGLADLEKYRATLAYTFDGTADGQPRQWTSTTTLVYVKDPRVFVYSVDQPADFPDPGPTWAAEVNGAAYRLGADGSCTASVPSADDPPPAEPAARLSGLIGGEAAGQETVGGRAADVFTFDGGALGFSGDTRATGRVWIASGGGYVVKYEVTTDAGPAYFGEGVSGTLTTDYQIHDVNTAASYDLPADCPPGLIEAPMTTDAVVTESLPGLLRYTTNVSVAEAAALYRDTSVAFGWTSNRTAAIGEDFAALSFDHDLLLIDVLVTDAGSGTEVTIVANWK